MTRDKNVMMILRLLKTFLRTFKRRHERLSKRYSHLKSSKQKFNGVKVLLFIVTNVLSYTLDCRIKRDVKYEGP